ncbi:MAG: TRAP transporter small permease [Sphaerochaetaceae bacterium]|nr:TRAP transporter small permease [Sphaerochaetaceae bacterium]
MTNNRKDVVFFLKNPEYLLSIAILAVILLSSLMQVLNRLIPAIKAPWTLELITYLFGALIWIGIALAIHDDSHVGIKSIYHKFPKKARKGLKIVHMCLFGIMLLFFGYLGMLALLSYARRGQSTPALHAPTWLMRSPIVIGALISLYRLGERIVMIVKDKDPEFKYDIPEGLADLSIEELLKEGLITETTPAQEDK